MFERISRGWALVGESWQVLKSDKELMLFPVLSCIACLLVMASFALPVIVSPTLRNAVISSAKEIGEHSEHGQHAEHEFGRHEREEGQGFKFNAQQIVAAAIGFVFYLVTSFVIVFFNTALVCCAFIRFNGGNPTVGDGLREARARLPQIFGWALLSATVGTILRQTEERAPALGRFVIGLIGMAWAAVTFLVVPILAAEKLGPFAAVKRSAGLLRKTWGEALVGQVSLGAVQMLFMLPIFAAFIVAGFISASMHSAWPAVAVGIFAVPYFILLAITFSTLQQILLAAVYQYAAQGTVPAGFSPELIESAFKRKE